MPDASRDDKRSYENAPLRPQRPARGPTYALTRLFDALEAETDRWFLWLPVLFAVGIGAYFALPSEPDSRIALALLLAATGIFLFARKAGLGRVLGLAALMLALGFAAAKARTELVRAPVLKSELRYASVTGYVTRLERRTDARDRLTLQVLTIDGLSAAERPVRIRVSLAGRNHAFQPGDAVSFRATLGPPPPPVAPGGFDFGRQAWFQQLGGIGYVTGKITPLANAPPAPLMLHIFAGIDKVRAGVNEKISAVLPGQNGAIAMALITGDRGGITEEVTRAMRDAGLAHILAISGLHMVIMAGSVFWLTRALLAAFPALVLRYPIKKWAAAASLIAAALYLALSGGSVPTIRAFLMMSIVMAAIMLDRPAITMRNVALAALAILIIAPESLFQPSFQMSFAAVVALVAAYEALQKRKAPARVEPTVGNRAVRWTGAFFAGAALTTLIAGTAIAPFAVYHFHRMTHFGLAANLIVTPLISLLIMPMALLSLIAMPFRLEAFPLMAMGFGIDLMVQTANWVAAWPGAVSVLPSLSGWALALIALGGLWLCLWQTRWRALGLVIVGVGLALSVPQHRPDVLIERDGKIAALRGPSGNLIFPTATASNYSVEKWLLADGDSTDATSLPKSTPFRCDPLGCIGTVKGKTIALIRKTGALAEDCRTADIVIAPFKLSKACTAPRIIIDRKALKTNGAHALYLDGLSIQTETVAGKRGARPWSQTSRRP
ncbi:MAG: ComEC/Rec2 family competence protein [Pseudomonadota bacterium]